jgi:hypothetical protein
MCEFENSPLMKRIKERVKFNELIFSDSEREFLLNNTSLFKAENNKLDIYKLIDQLIKEGKNQGYKISVTIE